MSDETFEQRLRLHLADVGNGLDLGAAPDVAAVQQAAAASTGWSLSGLLSKAASRVLIKVGLIVAAIAAAGVGGTVLGLGPAATLVNEESDTRVVVSPWITVEMAEQNDDVLWEVITDDPQPWRLVELEVYEDGIWKTAGDSVPVEQRPAIDSVAERTLSPMSETEFVVRSREDPFDGVWVPGPVAPLAVVSDDVAVEWMNGLITDIDWNSKVGDRYTVRSVDPTPTQDIPSELEKYLGVNLSETSAVVTSARDVIAGATGRTERVDRLLEYLGQLELAEAESTNNGGVDDLVVQGRGSRSQFATALALMARVADAPSRIVVGFAPGDVIDVDAAGRTRLELRGSHLRRWVEIYFDDLGWVRYDPAENVTE